MPASRSEPKPNTIIEDPARLAAVRATGLLDVRADQAFDRLARLAAQVLRAPVGIVSLIDDERQYYMGSYGLTGRMAEELSTPVPRTFCRFTVARDAPLVVENAATDPLVRGSPAVVEDGVRAYAGVPLRTADGQILGTLCVTDVAPRKWGTAETALLEDLAASAMTEIELRDVGRRLRAGEAAYAALLDLIDDLVCVAGRDGRITYVNRAWQQTLGYTLAEARALRPIDLVAPEHQGRYRDVALRLVRGERIADFEAVLVGKDGHRHVVRGGATATMENGVCVETRSVYRDLTRERQGEALGARLVSTIEATTDLVALMTREGRLVYLNRSGRVLVGLPEDADLGAVRSDDVFAERELERFGAEMIPGVLARGVWEAESTLVGAGGVEVPVSLVLVAHPSMRDDDASPYFVSMVARDLRQRVRDEATLRASESRFRGILERVRAPAAVLDAEARVAFANDRLLELTGHTREELTGASWYGSVVPPEDEVVLTREMIARGDVPPHYETGLLVRGGERLLIAWDSVALRDAEGRVTGKACIGQDVTDQRRVEQLKDQVISIVGHELRSPIGAVRGALQMLARRLPHLGGQERQLLDMATRNSDRLLKLVQDLLDYERLDAGAVSFDQTLVSGEALLEQAREVMTVAADAAQVRLVIEPAPAEVWADPNRIVQVLVNLLANAVKFSPAGGTVTAGVAREGTEVVFRVRDEGRGIPPDKLEAVFDRFTQVHLSDAKRGSGLGLAIARAIVRQHGGRIWAESTPGAGATFVVALPPAAEAIVREGEPGE